MPSEQRKNMKIGILLTDHVMDELIEKHGDMDDFYKYIFKKVDPTIELEIFDVVEGIYPNNINDCEGYLITGSRFSVYDQIDWIIKLKEFVKELDLIKKPLIGVCFGHQLIAQVLGGEAKEAKSGWTVGNQIYNLLEDIPWIKEEVNSFKLLHSHKDQVSKLPDNAILIASTENVPIAMYTIGSHIFSHQGHPEFKPEYVLDVAKTRREALGEEVYLKALDSLTSQIPDNEIIAKCWINFFKKEN